MCLNVTRPRIAPAGWFATSVTPMLLGPRKSDNAIRAARVPTEPQEEADSRRDSYSEVAPYPLVGVTDCLGSDPRSRA